MRNILFPPILGLLAIALPLPASAVETPDFVALAKELKPAVVNISTSKTVQQRRPMRPGPNSPYNEFFNEFFEEFFRGQQPSIPREERSLGSGFIISEDGYILTNEHVVSGADEVKVRLSDGRTFDASIEGLDPKLDLALLKISSGESLPTAKLGSSENLEIGEWVMAIGNPFGLEQTVTVGIVSAKERVIGAGPYDDFIQTDASINPGNSGGPLFDTSGRVVGINTAIVAGGQGIGFAIPVSAAKQIISQLKETGHVTRGWLGVSVQELSPELAESFGLEEPKGALVAEVVEGSPAEDAGIKRGDIIIGFGGQQIANMHDLPRLVAATEVGKKTELTVFRNGSEKTLRVKIGKLEEAEKAPADVPGVEGRLGFTVAEVTPEIARRYNIEKDRGVIVTAIRPGLTANLQTGDLILEIDGREISGLTDFRKVIAETEKGKVLRLLVQRQRSLLFTTLQVQ